MDVAERELIRSNMHQVDLLLRKVDRKVEVMIDAMIAQTDQIHSIIKQIEELKKPIYSLLDKEGGG